MTTERQFILTLSCRDTMGIVHAVSGLLDQAGCNIIDSQQFGDLEGEDATGLLFHACACRGPAATGQPQRPAAAVRAHTPAVRHAGALSGARAQAAGAVDGEEQVLALTQQLHIDLVVLARYMQILSAPMRQAPAGRAINIHHSFLPSFKGARPCFQAHARGVKLIGATAHDVTADLDEGPIIEQHVQRVDHTLSAEDFTAAGRDIESMVLARAVRWHTEHRVLVNGHQCVVFR